jgi:hypothetical protein
MSESFVFFDINTKLCSHIVTSSSIDNYEDGKIYNMSIAIDLEHFPNIPFQTIVDTYHWLGEGTLTGIHLTTENPLYEWDPVLCIYKEPDGYLETTRAMMISKVNTIAREKIFDQYPIYRQLNIGRDSTTIESNLMFDYIDNIRNESNISNDQLLNASTIAEMEDIVSQFQQRI